MKNSAFKTIFFIFSLLFLVFLFNCSSPSKEESFTESTHREKNHHQEKITSSERDKHEEYSSFQEKFLQKEEKNAPQEKISPKEMTFEEKLSSKEAIFEEKNNFKDSGSGQDETREELIAELQKENIEENSLPEERWGKPEEEFKERIQEVSTAKEKVAKPPHLTALFPSKGYLWGVEVTIKGQDLIDHSGRKPMVIFGNKKAKILQFKPHELKVLAPIQEKPMIVDVKVSHQGGTSPQVLSFTYERKKPKGATHGGYFTYEEILLFLEEVSKIYPQRTKLFSIGKSVEGRPIWMLKIAKNPKKEDPSKPSILFSSGIHPREQQPYYFTIQLTRDLLYGYSRDSKIKKLIDENQIYILIAANPDGKIYDLPANGGRYRRWRKNRARNKDGSYGVDLNRNATIRWGGASYTPSKTDYQGPHPFSEPESRALRDFIKKYPIRLWLEIHSFARTLWFPSNLTKTDHAFYKAMSQGFLKKQQKAYKPTILNPPGSFPTKRRGGATGMLYIWAYYTQSVFGIILEVSKGTAKDGFYPTPSFIAQEYAKNGRDAMLFLIDFAKKLPPRKKLIPTKDPQLILERLTIDDNKVDDSYGNNNKKWEPGETIEIRHYLKNIGKRTAREVWATLTSEDPYVVVEKEYISSYGDIAPGTSVSINPKQNSTDFAVRLLKKTPKGHVVKFVLHVFDKEHHKWELSFSLKVH